MANTEVEDTTEQNDQSFELRRSLNNAYAFVKGQESVQSFAAITFEELIDKQIERISGKGTDLRPNEMDRVDKILGAVTQAVEKIKSLPDEVFTDHDPNKDVNTAPEPDEVG